MTIKERLISDMKAAMKAKETLKKETLRMLISELNYAQVAPTTQGELRDSQALKSIAAYQKKLMKSVKDYPPGEQKERLLKEIAIIAHYLPKKASTEEVDKAVSAVLLETSERHFGLLMKKTLAKLGDNAEGQLVSERIKEKLKEG